MILLRKKKDYIGFFTWNKLFNYIHKPSHNNKGLDDRYGKILIICLGTNPIFSPIHQNKSYAIN